MQPGRSGFNSHRRDSSTPRRSPAARQSTRQSARQSRQSRQSRHSDLGSALGHRVGPIEGDKRIPNLPTPPGEMYHSPFLPVREQGAQARDGERLLGSSEVLGSLIGKFKYMAGERGLHGLTGMVFAFGACVGRHAIGTVQAAMEEITNHDVWDWCRSHLGSTVQSVRQQITQALQPEQTRKPLDIKNG